MVPVAEEVMIDRMISMCLLVLGSAFLPLGSLASVLGRASDTSPATTTQTIRSELKVERIAFTYDIPPVLCSSGTRGYIERRERGDGDRLWNIASPEQFDDPVQGFTDFRIQAHRYTPFITLRWCRAG